MSVAVVLRPTVATLAMASFVRLRHDADVTVPSLHPGGFADLNSSTGDRA